MPTPALPLTPAIAHRVAGSPLLLVLDIDGTISPIAPRPDQAIVPPATQRILDELAHTDAVYVAVISGRSVDDARRLVGLADVWIVGNHGFEIAAPNRSPAVRGDVSRFLDRLAAASARVSEVAQDKPGVIVEDKRLTLSVHYRLSHPRIVSGLIAEIATVARECGLKLTRGKEVLELRPPVEVDKGTAAVELAQTLGTLRVGASLFCAGDDRTDEDMFRALRARQPACVTVHVGGDSATTETAAEFAVEDTDQMRILLEQILEQRRAAVGVR